MFIPEARLAVWDIFLAAGVRAHSDHVWTSLWALQCRIVLCVVNFLRALMTKTDLQFDTFFYAGLSLRWLKVITGLSLISCSFALSYRFGRKPLFFITVGLQGVTSLIQAASISWVMFSILNCLKGYCQNYPLSLTLGEHCNSSDGPLKSSSDHNLS